MVGESTPQSVRVRFSAYIDELREFFQSRGVAFGNAQDLPLFAQSLAADGAFAEEMSSMVRSIVYREDERLGRGELLEIVSVAVGGPAMENAAQEMQSSVRQIFLFLHGALRNREFGMQETPVLDEGTPVTASDILATTPPEPAVVGVEAVLPARPVAGDGRMTQAAYAAKPHADRGMHLRAAEMAAASAGFREKEAEAAEPPPRRAFRWVVPALALLIVLLAVGFYLSQRSPGAGFGTVRGGMMAGQSALQSVGCVAPMGAGVTRDSLLPRVQWAHHLMDEGLDDEALPAVREVARMDPGYPGIRMDESQVLLHLKRPDDAREAIDNQINVADCLARLPAAELDNYCAAQYAPEMERSCRPQLTHLRQASQMQAALVHIQLGHAIGDASSREAISELTRGAQPSRTAPSARPRRTEPLPPAREGDTASPALRSSDGTRSGRRPE